MRHEMLAEAIDTIAALCDGEANVNHRGRHFDLEAARLWDPPDERVPIDVGGIGRGLLGVLRRDRARADRGGQSGGVHGVV